MISLTCLGIPLSTQGCLFRDVSAWWYGSIWLYRWHRSIMGFTLAFMSGSCSNNYRPIGKLLLAGRSLMPRSYPGSFKHCRTTLRRIRSIWPSLCNRAEYEADHLALRSKRIWFCLSYSQSSYIDCAIRAPQVLFYSHARRNHSLRNISKILYWLECRIHPRLRICSHRSNFPMTDPSSSLGQQAAFITCWTRSMVTSWPG